MCILARGLAVSLGDVDVTIDWMMSDRTTCINIYIYMGCKNMAARRFQMSFGTS